MTPRTMRQQVLMKRYIKVYTRGGGVEKGLFAGNLQ